MRTWMKEVRTTKRLTQADVARIAKISPSSYCDIERGFRNPSTQRAKAIGNALGVEWTIFFE